MNKKNVMIIVPVWIILAVLNTGFFVADFDGDFPDLCWHRQTVGEGLGWSLLFGPIGWVITPFVTGFYKHGWTLVERRPGCLAEHKQ